MRSTDHGGAGTTAAALRAGIPSVIIPFLGDQPFWSYRAYKLGVSPTLIDRRRLTVDQLAAAISEATEDETLRHRAASLGSRIRLENGVAQAVDIIQHTIFRQT